MSSTLTVRPNDEEEIFIEQVKKKYQIKVSTRALLFAAQKVLQLEKEVEQLKIDKQKLQFTLREYKEANSSFLSGLSRLTKLNNT